MHKYVMMGVQGSGKSTHSQMLAADLEIVHISMGDIFRWHVRNHTKTGAHIQRVMASGELLSDDLVQAVITQRLSDHDWNFGFVLDGFPRNRPQAEFFLENYDIDGVIVLDVPDAEVRRRVLNRRECADCGTSFHLLDNPPTVSGKCDECGGQLITREDDTEEALAVRLRTYHETTSPILEVFRARQYVIMVDARPAAEAVQAEIMQKLGLPPSKTPHAAPGHLHDTQRPGRA